MKRLLALILAMAMTFSVVMPSVAAAAEYAGASSSVSDGSLSIQEAEESSSSVEVEKEPDTSSSEEKSSGERSQQEEKDSGEKSSEEKSSGEKSTEEKTPEQDVPSGEAEESKGEESVLAPEKENLKSVKGSLKTVDGVKYTVTVSYGEDAEIPDGAKLSLVELNPELTKEELELKENKDRPYKTEEFVSEKALEQETFDLHQGLKVRESDYVLFTKFLDVALEKNGKSVQPKAPVTVTIETDVVKEGASDALEAAFYDSEATKEWKTERKKLVEEQEKKIKSGKLKEEDAKRFPEKVFKNAKIINETQKKKGTKISFETEFVSRLGISGVVKELKSWKVKDDTVSVYGPRGIKAKVSTESMKAPEAGVEKVRAFSVETNEKKEKTPDYDVTYWVSTWAPETQNEETESLATQAQEAGSLDTGVVISKLKNGKAKKELVGTEGTSAPVAIQEGDTIGVAYDTGLREKTLESDKVTLEGMMPKNADVTANDMLWRYSKPEDVKEDVNKGDAETLAAYDITIESKNQEFQPEKGESIDVSISGVTVDENKKLEVWHVKDGGTVEVITDVKVEGDSVSFAATGFSVYMVVQYTVDFHYGEGDFDFSIIGGNTISMKELVARLHVVEVQDQAALDAVLAELHPAAEKEKAIIEDEDETETVPEKSAPTKPVQWPEEIERFVANIASVKWSNDDVARVTKVKQQTTVGDLVDSLGLVNQFSAEMTDSQIEAAMNVVLAQGDWAFISTQPFFTEEKLTITMQSGEVYEIGVTDAAGYANVTLRNPTVNIKTGDTTTSHASKLNFALTNNGLARVTGKNTNAAGTEYYIPDKITYNGKDYLVYDVGSLSPAAINGRTVYFDDDLCLRMLDADQTQLVDIVDRILAKMMVDSGLAKVEDFDGQNSRPAASAYTNNEGLTNAQVDALATKNGFAIGAKNGDEDNIFELFKRAKYDEDNNKVTIELKYFQKMKKNVPLDFIFVYDDSGTMASVAYNHTTQKNQDGGNIRYAATQSVWCRIALQVILKGIMDQQAKGYDIHMAPIAFASNAFYTPNTFYETYTDAKRAIGTIYTSGGTEHYKALEDALALSKYSAETLHRNPIVVYLSDFHSNANTARAKTAAANLRNVINPNNGEHVQVYTIHMFEPNFRYDRNIATDAHHMYILNDTRPISDLLTIFDTITKDAIGYYVGKNLSVQDALSDGLASMAQNVKISVPSANGSSAKDGSNTTWTFTNGENRLQAGKIYSETIEVQLQDDVVISPEMSSNKSAKVVKTVEDENGGLHPTTVNEIGTQPKPKKSLTMVVGRLDKSGNQTTDTIPDAKFTLSNGSTTINLTSDENGRLTVPSDFHFTEGSYTLKQLSTDNLEDETPAMDMPTTPTWTITVDENGIMRASGGSPEMTVKKGQFRIWNKQHVEIMPTLIPVTVQKTWINGPKGGETVPFTIYGEYNNQSYVLAAYDGARKDSANSISALTAGNVTVSTDASGHTTWTKRVFVPDRAGSAVFYTEDSSGNNQSYNYVIAEGDAPTAPGGYYTKGEEAVKVNSDTIYETIYKTTGGWETYTGGTTIAQLHLNVNDSKYNGTDIEGSNTNSKNAYSLVYKNLKKVYVEYTYYRSSNRSEDIQAITSFNVTNDGNDKSAPGVQFLNVKLPTSWLTQIGNKRTYIDGKYTRNDGEWNYYNSFEITKLIFFKNDGTSQIIYDKNNNSSSNDNYLNKTPKTDFTEHGYYNGVYTGYLLVFEKNGENRGSHSLITADSNGQTIKRLQPQTEQTITNKTFSNSLILTMENTFVPLRTLDITSTWKDSSTDAGSTGQIKSVTYEVLKKDGENWVPAVGTDGEALSTDTLTADVAARAGASNTYEAKLNLTLPEGEYKVRQASYTLPNGRVVSADNNGAFAPYKLTNGINPNPTVDDTNRKNTYVWENTRKYFDATVRTVWSPELAADDDPTGGSGLPYKLSYRSYNGGTVEEHNEDGTSLKSEGWTHEHSSIPAYGVDGVETQIVLNASDALAIAYNTEITRTEDSETHQTFTITNTERRVTFSVRKDWLDAEGQEIPEADRQPVTIEIWGIEKKAGGDATGQGVLPPSALRLKPENYPEPFKSKLWNNVDQNEQLTAEKPNPNGFFEWDGIWYAIETTFTTNANQFQNKNVVGSGRVLPFSGRVIDSSFYDINQNGDQLVMKQDAPLDVKEFQMGDVVIYNNKYRILRESPGQYANVSTLVDLGWGDIETSSGSGNTQAEYPHSTQFEVDALITKEYAKQFDADTKRVKADGVTAEYTITANDGWTRSFELPARYVYFAREVKVDTLPLENEDNTENLVDIDIFQPYYDYDQGAVTVAISNRFPIARVSNDGGANWHYFDTLLTVQAENYPEHQGAFNYANTLSGDVEIELLRRTNPFYTMKSGFTFDTPTSVTLRTTQDPDWNPGDTKFTSAIYRGYNGTSLITFSKAGGSLTVENIILDGNKNSVKDEEGNEIASFTGSDSGGLISITGATLNIKDGATLRNSKLDYDKDGGAVYAQNSTVSMTGGLIQNNEVVGEGGGIYLNGTIDTHAQADWRVYVANTGSSMTMTGGKIKGNKADLVGNTKGQGGGVYVSATGSLTMSGGSIEENTATMGGGVQTGYNGGFIMTDGTIARNIANSGGGICQWSDTPGTINGGKLTGNSATAKGSAIYVVGGNTFNINGGRITKNNVAGSDGAVSIQDGSSRLNFSGSAFVYDNVDGSAQKNVVLGYESSDDDTGNHKNGVIRMMGSFTDEAHVGIWIPDALQAAHDQPAKPFGYYADATYENEDKFTSDRQQGLIAVKGTNHTLYWADYIARVKTDTGTDAQKAWKYFEALIDVKEGNRVIIPGAFNYAQTLGGNVVIETLKETHERYTLPESFTFSKTGLTSLEIRTTDGLTNDQGESVRSTLKNGQNTASMISFDLPLSGLTAPEITVENLILDGNGQSFSGQGGAINTYNKLTLDNADITGFTANKGAAVYVNGDINPGHLTVKDSRITGNTAAVGSGAIDSKLATSDLTFNGSTWIYGNTDGSRQSNVWLSHAAVTIIKTSGLGDNALVGVRPKDEIFDNYGEAGKQFGTYSGGDTTAAALGHFVNDEKGYYGTKTKTGSGIMWQAIPVPRIPIYVEKVWGPNVQDSEKGDVQFKIWGTNGSNKYPLNAYTSADPEDTSETAKITAADNWKKLVYVPEYYINGTDKIYFFSQEGDNLEYNYEIQENDKALPTPASGSFKKVEELVPGRLIPGVHHEGETVSYTEDEYQNFQYTYYLVFNAEPSWHLVRQHYPYMQELNVTFKHKKTGVQYTMKLDTADVQTSGDYKYYVMFKAPDPYPAAFEVTHLDMNGDPRLVKDYSLTDGKRLFQVTSYAFVGSTMTYPITKTYTQEVQDAADTVEPATLRMTNSIAYPTMVPLIVEKKWDLPEDKTYGGEGADYTEAPFTIYGVKGTAKTPLTAYSVCVPDSTKTVTRLTASDTCMVPTDSGSESRTWAKLIYVQRGDYDSFEIGEPDISTTYPDAAWEVTTESKSAQWEEVSDGYIDGYIEFNRTLTTDTNTAYKNIRKLEFYFWDDEANKNNYYCTQVTLPDNLDLSGLGTYTVQVRLPKSLDISTAQLMYGGYYPPNGAYPGNPMVVSTGPDALKKGLSGKGAAYGIVFYQNTADVTPSGLPAFKQGDMTTTMPYLDNVTFKTSHTGSNPAITGTSKLYTFPYAAQKDSYLIVTNHSYICKIVDKNRDEHGFSSLKKAVTWVENDENQNLLSASKTATIEMLVDYNMPSSDTITVSKGDNITLTTAHSGTYQYSGNVATIKRGFDGDSLFTVNHADAKLAFTNIILDGDKDNHTCTDSGDSDGKGGLVNVAQGTLKVNDGTTLRNSKAKKDGAGIYVSKGAKVELSGKLSFSGNIVVKDGYSEKKNGGQPYHQNGDSNKYQIHQDIFIEEEGAESTTDAKYKPASLIVTGDIEAKDGSIWVWAENQYRYKQKMPFAKIADGVTFVENEKDVDKENKKYDVVHLKAFRNAQDDETTENGTNTYLFGTIEGDVNGLIYWTGSAGMRKVVLKKVRKTDNPGSTDFDYEPQKGITFTVYRRNSEKPYTVKDEEGNPVTLDNKRSLESGVFWIGELPYDWYIVEENTNEENTNPKKYFYIVVDESGVCGTLVKDDKGIERYKANGYGSNRGEAEKEAEKKYNERKNAG